jgi:flagellar hook-basal body complex protein FliE
MVDPTAAMASGIAPNNLVVGSDEALNQVSQALLHQGNGEKFVFELPKDIAAPNAVSPTASVTPSVVSQPTSFGHLAQEMVRDVNSYQQVAGEKVRDVLMGNGKTSIQEAMVAVQESTVAFQLLSQVRNKLIDSYQELNRMQI